MGVLQCDGVGGAAMFTLMHLKVPAMLLPRLCRTDLGERHVMMRYNEEDMHAPFLEVSLPSFFFRSGVAARRCYPPPVFIDGGV
jgi:hypothetical protein